MPDGRHSGHANYCHSLLLLELFKFFSWKENVLTYNFYRNKFYLLDITYI